MKRFWRWLTGGQAALAEADRADRLALLEQRRLAGAVTYVCPECGGTAWSMQPGATLADVVQIHRLVNGSCPGTFPTRPEGSA